MVSRKPYAPLTLSKFTELASGGDGIQTQDSLCLVLFSHLCHIYSLSPDYVPAAILGSEGTVVSENRQFGLMGDDGPQHVFRQIIADTNKCSYENRTVW